MLRSLSPLLTATALSLFLLLGGGCATSKPSNFYVLHSMENPAGEGKTPSAKQDVVIMVGPVTVPEYLDRPEIVTRTGRSNLKLAEFDRWAESLQKNVTRVLSDNISFLLTTDRAAVIPWPSSIQAHYQVIVDLAQLDALPDGKVILAATWSIYDSNGPKLLVTRRSNLQAPVDSSDYDAIVLAESRALEALSREIAQTLNSYLREMPPG